MCNFVAYNRFYKLVYFYIYSGQCHQHNSTAKYQQSRTYRVGRTKTFHARASWAKLPSPGSQGIYAICEY